MSQGLSLGHILNHDLKNTHKSRRERKKERKRVCKYKRSAKTKMVSVICALAAHKNVNGGVVLLDSFINILISDGNLTLKQIIRKNNAM